MMRTHTKARRGFSLVELITALTILAIIGVALTKMTITQTRTFQYENAGRRARAASRGAMNVMLSDLRMAQDIGAIDSLDTVNNRWIDIRVPIVFGVVCKVSGGNAELALVPADSFQAVTAKYGGYAIRNKTTSQYGYSVASSSDNVTVLDASNTDCATAGYYADTMTVAGRKGTKVRVSPAPPAGTAVGDVAFIWQHVRYQFDTSGVYKGRYGLYRRVRGKADTDSTFEELIAPFSSSARFNYFTDPPAYHDTALKVAPANLNTIRGVQVFLPAESSDTIPGRTTPNRATTTTSIFFKNTRVQ
jgi:prepilin-type N-terminal cleavage/methylation domain-containing protein